VDAESHDPSNQINLQDGGSSPQAWVVEAIAAPGDPPEGASPRQQEARNEEGERTGGGGGGDGGGGDRRSVCLSVGRSVGQSSGWAGRSEARRTRDQLVSLRIEEQWRRGRETKQSEDGIK
jgi:hypothetical protein